LFRQIEQKLKQRLSLDQKYHCLDMALSSILLQANSAVTRFQNTRKSHHYTAMIYAVPLHSLFFIFVLSPVINRGRHFVFWLYMCPSVVIY